MIGQRLFALLLAFGSGILLANSLWFGMGPDKVVFMAMATMMGITAIALIVDGEGGG